MAEFCATSDTLWEIRKFYLIEMATLREGLVQAQASQIFMLT